MTPYQTLHREPRTQEQAWNDLGYQFVWCEAPDGEGWAVTKGTNAVIYKLFKTKEEAIMAAVTHYGESRCSTG